jgi:hypothetical protein
VKEAAYRFAGATCKGKSSARQICKRAAIVYYMWAEDVGCNDHLQMLHELDSLVAILQFGNKEFLPTILWLSNPSLITLGFRI